MIVRKAFDGWADLQAIITSARSQPDVGLRVADLPYRLCSWALDDPANASLWVDEEGRLTGWAVMQAPFWTIDYGYRQQDQGLSCGQGLHHAQGPIEVDPLHTAVLSWADARARALLGTVGGRPRWYATVFADQVERCQDLEQAGFASQAHAIPDPWSKVLMRRPARMLVPEDRAVLPERVAPDGMLPKGVPPGQGYLSHEGFRLRPLAGAAEVEGLRRAAPDRLRK